jgi:dGTPase
MVAFRLEELVVNGLRTRDAYLEHEQQWLAPYASKAAETRGRAHPEPEHSLRSPFERDRDRIIHSSAFRKLEYKTQVFVNHEGDYYRTRLTHTLEAAQIARSAARFLHLNEDLTEAIALVHDVGHPPFGHAGEEALQRCMAAHGGFEHNLHSLRVVDRLEQHYRSFRGLNLTWEVREGIVKHSKAFDSNAPTAGLEDFAGARWPSLEAQLVDLCDEIAYNAHDVDDGLAAGMITLDELHSLELWRRVTDTAPFENIEHARYQGVRSLINAQVVDLVETTAHRLAHYAPATADEIRAAPELLAALSEPMATMNSELRSFLFDHVYRHFRITRMGIKARRIVTDLFDSLTAEPGQLPTGLLVPESERAAGTEAFANSECPDADDLPRRVCDYLAGLSDREALNEYSRLFDPFVTS